ncbi:MAG: hypothetical protein KAT68_16260 [Bacteroidales bacterium]|nr:hypothetical protein [Bacteroidales bacterium]
MSINYNILIIDSIHEKLVEELTFTGFNCSYRPEINKNEILKIIPDYDGLILRSKITIDKIFIDNAKKLKFIGRVGSGLDNIDVKYAEKKGIKCLNSPEGNRDAVGEHTVSLLLSLFNKICLSNCQVKSGQWKRETNRGIEIKNKTIGIIGYGNMGSAFAQRLRGFEANVIAYDKYKTNYSDQYVTESTLNTIFEKTDILSIHVPLTEETYYMVNNEFINSFKKDIYLINTSRGKVVKTDDLVSNLKSGKIEGAALDVLEYEDNSFENLHSGKFPEAYKILLESNNVIITPHIAGLTNESKIKLSEVLAKKIISLIK